MLEIVAESIKDQVGGASGDGVSVAQIIQNVLDAIFILVGVLAVLVIVYGGVQYAISQGDSGKLAKAKMIVLGGIIGLVISLLAFAIVNFTIYMLQ